jgi:hypothetical protein
MQKFIVLRSTKAVDIIVGSARLNPKNSPGEGKLLVNFPSIGPGGPGTKIHKKHRLPTFESNLLFSDKLC